MNYISTRNSSRVVSLSEALQQGLAPDGGLFVPKSWPLCDWQSWPDDLTYQAVAERVLRPFFADDPLSYKLSDICQQALSFPIPLQQINDNTYLIQLYHGPTLSFKDVGAQFLASCLQHLTRDGVMTIFVATSGDTGSAVAAAFHQKRNIRVVVLFPDGQISQRQQQQITCWGDNVLAVAVDGCFDDCQSLVKSVLVDPWWMQQTKMNTSNSINIGRLLPQVTYYAFHSWCSFKKTGQQAQFVVPSGNLGNVTAAYIAQRLGFPIDQIVMSTNANKAVVDYFDTGVFEPRQSINTLASAMDVGNPSNLERLQYLYPDFDTLHANAKAILVTDIHIKETIAQVHQNHSVLLCPHTATAYYARAQLNEKSWMIAATADPCKFEQVLEPLLDCDVPPTSSLQQLLDRPNYMKHIAVDQHALRECYQDYFF
jgi:threonine synthase